jgi:hypothetical protein
MNARVALAIAVLTGGAGCSDIITPSRTPRYLSDNAGDTFHWPADRIPVRYFVDPRGALPRLVRNGLSAWQDQFLYGEFRAVVVADSAVADVIVHWQDSVPPDVPPDTTGALGTCDGVTTYVLDSTKTMTGPEHVSLRVRLGYTLPQIAECFRRVVDHELGHSLGILSHSPATTDLMYGTPAVERPTERDRNTAQVLYHTPPTIFPPRR